MGFNGFALKRGCTSRTYAVVLYKVLQYYIIKMNYLSISTNCECVCTYLDMKFFPSMNMIDQNHMMILNNIYG